MINPCLILTHSRLSNSYNELYAITRQIQRYGLVLILKNKYSIFFCSRLYHSEKTHIFFIARKLWEKRQYAKAGYEINESISDTHIGKYLYPVSMSVVTQNHSLKICLCCSSRFIQRLNAAENIALLCVCY